MPRAEAFGVIALLLGLPFQTYSKDFSEAPEYKEWLNEDVSYIITDQEVPSLQKLPQIEIVTVL
jgi:hypothetical protein